MNPRHAIDPVATFDIETENWDRFVLGALHVIDGRTSQVFDWHHERDYLEAIFSIEGNLYAHFGGRFDFLWLFDAARRFGFLDRCTVELVESGSRIIVARVKREGRGDLILRDSQAMFPLRLAQIGGKEAVGLDCDGKRDDCKETIRIQAALNKPQTGCGGYCQIRRDMPRTEYRKVEHYCIQDCIALADGLQDLIAFAREKAGITLAATIGASAWKSVVTQNLIAPTTHSVTTWERVKQAYFGGRVILARSFAPLIYRHDITSSYPHQCCQPLPTGEAITMSSPREARRAMAKARPGIYECKVHVPDMYVPPLPARALVDGLIRNVYPTGRFSGAWALPEIEYAESLGCRFEPTGAVVYPHEEILFSDFMHDLISLRLKVGKDSAHGAMCKWWGNSLYGKFAQRPPDSRMMLGSPALVPEGSIPTDPGSFVWRVPLQRSAPIPKSSHIEKAAYITARARVQQHRMMREDVVYGDTDSVFSTEPRFEFDGVGEGLGSWSFEGKGHNFEGRAPKLYRFRPVKGPPKIKGKGLPIPPFLDELAAERLWNAITRGTPLHFSSGVESFRSAVEKGGPLFVRREMKRHASKVVDYGDRIGVGNGNSRPCRARDLEFARVPSTYHDDTE